MNRLYMLPTLPALTIILTGCIPPRMISGSHHYDVYIDPRFPNWQHESVTNAVLEWQVNTDETVTFDFINQPTSHNPIIVILASDKEFLHKHFHPTTVGRTYYRGVDSFIRIDTDEGPRNFHQIALHEMGHALGLDHNGPGSTMYDWSDDAADYITCKDLHAFCDVWNCNADNFPLCGHKNVTKTIAL